MLTRASTSRPRRSSRAHRLGFADITAARAELTRAPQQWLAAIAGGDRSVRAHRAVLLGEIAASADPDAAEVRRSGRAPWRGVEVAAVRRTCDRAARRLDLRCERLPRAHARRYARGVAAADDVALLEQGYRFLRGIEHRLRVVHDQPIQRLPEAHDEIAKLARRSGFPDGDALVDRVQRWQHEIRAAYARVLGA